jgi:hypothetical protein
MYTGALVVNLLPPAHHYTGVPTVTEVHICTPHPPTGDRLSIFKRIKEIFGNFENNIF